MPPTELSPRGSRSEPKKESVASGLMNEAENGRLRDLDPAVTPDHSVTLQVPQQYHESLRTLARFLTDVENLRVQLRSGALRANVPKALLDPKQPLEDLVEQCLPASAELLLKASQGGLFSALPVAFDPTQSVGAYLATHDRDREGKPYLFLDMGALIATQPFGENDPQLLAALLQDFAFVSTRYAHSEYQTTKSLQLKAELCSIAPAGTPRFFMVNTGAEAVENAMKAVLLHRVKTSEIRNPRELFIVSFKGGFHGRTLACLAVTQRKRAREGFPTFDWPAVPFPAANRNKPEETVRREVKSLHELWKVFVGRQYAVLPESSERFSQLLRSIDRFLETYDREDVPQFLVEERSKIPEDVRRRALTAAGVLLELVQGEGGLRFCTSRFVQRLRLLTLVFDVPLIFDEVQTGWGMTGERWAHDRFNLPAPPDAFTWGKRAQNGVLFVSEELAAFFQEEKKFNTTWEGDSVGMLRLLHHLPRLDLDQIARAGAMTEAMLEDLCYRYPELLQNLRGSGVMWAFDVARPDLRDALRDRAFRHGLILLPAGETTLRFYPRYDVSQSELKDAHRMLVAALDDIRHGRYSVKPMLGPKVRFGTLECSPEALEVIPLTPESFEQFKDAVHTVEVERYGDTLLSVPMESIQQTAALPNSVAIALRDNISHEVVAYGVGGPLEEFNEHGTLDDPHWEDQEGRVFYLHAVASLPSVQNRYEIENILVNAIESQAAQRGYRYLSTVIEEDFVNSRPAWEQNGSRILSTIENYLGSGTPFCYVQATLPAVQ